MYFEHGAVTVFKLGNQKINPVSDCANLKIGVGTPPNLFFRDQQGVYDFSRNRTNLNEIR